MQASSSATIVHAKASNVVSLEGAQRARLSFVATWRRTIMRGDHRLNVYARAVACALAERMDAQGECWPGLEKIATEAGCSKRKAQDAIAELVEAGYLRTERKQSNHYFAVNTKVAGDASSRVAQRATEGNQESKGAKAPLANEGLTSFDLRESNESEGALALGLTPRPAPESEGHRGNTIETEKLGSWQTLQEQDEPTLDEFLSGIGAESASAPAAIPDRSVIVPVVTIGANAGAPAPIPGPEPPKDAIKPAGAERPLTEAQCQSWWGVSLKKAVVLGLVFDDSAARPR